jgi:ABC-2 type transport system permease protein
MLQTLLVNLKLHFREKAQLFWLFAFPIILATMFNGMFGNIAESYALHTVDVVVVNNDDWRASPGAQMLVDGISSDTGATGADGDHAKVDDAGNAMTKLITVTEAASMEAADRALTPRRRADCPSTVVGNCSWPFPKPRKHPPRM